MQILVAVSGVPALLQRFKGLETDLAFEMMRAVREQANDVRREARREAPLGVTGTLRRRIRVRVDRRALAATVKARAPHAHLATKGRRPGKMPPPARLVAWAALRGLAGKEFILARAIAARGTRGVPFMETARARTESAFPPRVQAAVERAIQRFNI